MRLDERGSSADDPLGRGIGACEDREDHRQARALEPQPAEVVVGVGSSNIDLSAASPISSVASAGSPSATCSASGRSTRTSTHEVALGRDGHRRDRLERRARHEPDRSTAPSDETQSRGRMRRALRVLPVLDRGDRREVDAALEERAVELGRNARTSSTSASRRKKSGAMFTYEMRPSRIIGDPPPPIP